MNLHVCFDYPEGHSASGSCVRCGRILAWPLSECASPERLAAQRAWNAHATARAAARQTDLCDQAFEIEATAIAARQAGVNGDSLSAFAIARKQPGPVRDHATRDFRQEVAEELADARNYLVWWMEQLREADALTVEVQWNLMQALGAVARAYHHAVGGVE